MAFYRVNSSGGTPSTITKVAGKSSAGSGQTISSTLANGTLGIIAYFGDGGGSCTLTGFSEITSAWGNYVSGQGVRVMLVKATASSQSVKFNGWTQCGDIYKLE